MADAQDAPSRTSVQQGLSCRECGETKPPSEFYVSNKTKCKECVKARVRARSRNNPAVQEYDRRRAKLPHRQELRTRITKRWRDNNPEAYKAHTAVSNAIRDGRLIKEPCLFCGDSHVHAHHRDYSKPLDVVWLCPKCHHRLHSTFPETEGKAKAS